MTKPDFISEPVLSPTSVSKPEKERVRRSIIPQKLKRVRQDAFLKKLAESGSVTQSAAHAGVNLCTPYEWCAVDLDFKEAMESARGIGEKTVLALLEEEIQRRALAGKEDPGSPNLLMFRTKRLDPAYRDNATVSVNAVGPVAIQLNFGTPLPTQQDGDTTAQS
ncbi:MAG: hypothetical protein HOP22_03370 [Nitrospiraceae bacterium]|nr:hypothetical protein [Nitrospiraceae bacterium]